ncbi:MAG: helix-turn-helix domain-containing protein [Planctomycetes bacterium]|nr:helix-turn-helix domain-containing protein [Planctomycetota bacterium]
MTTRDTPERNSVPDSTSEATAARMLKLREVAALLAINERTVRSTIAAGRLRCVRIGRAVRIDARDLEAFIERSKRGRK